MGEETSLISEAVNQKGLSVRPCTCIMSFWQGVVEIIFRIICIVTCTICFISSVIVLYYEYQRVYRYEYGRLSNQESFSFYGQLSGQVSLRLSLDVAIRKLITISASLVICGSVIVILWQAMFIAIRFLNISSINQLINVVLILDFLICLSLGMLLISGSITASYSIRRQTSPALPPPITDTLDIGIGQGPPQPVPPPLPNPPSLGGGNPGDFGGPYGPGSSECPKHCVGQKCSSSLSILMVMSILASIIVIMTGVWALLFVILKWNRLVLAFNANMEA